MIFGCGPGNDTESIECAQRIAYWWKKRCKIGIMGEAQRRIRQPAMIPIGKDFGNARFSQM